VVAERNGKNEASPLKVGDAGAAVRAPHVLVARKAQCLVQEPRQPATAVAGQARQMGLNQPHTFDASPCLSGRKALSSEFWHDLFCRI
jgi:hypothetical protein